MILMMCCDKINTYMCIDFTCITYSQHKILIYNIYYSHLHYKSLTLKVLSRAII